MEQPSTRPKRRWGAPSPIAIDLGANICTHTLYLASLGAEVHAFEPLQANMDLLECSVAAKDLRTRIHLNRVAMSDRPAPPTCIQADEGNFGHAFMVPNGQCQNTAPVSCMDDYDEQASLPSPIFILPPPPKISTYLFNDSRSPTPKTTSLFHQD